MRLNDPHEEAEKKIAGLALKQDVCTEEMDTKERLTDRWETNYNKKQFNTLL